MYCLFGTKILTRNTLSALSIANHYFVGSRCLHHLTYSSLNCDHLKWNYAGQIYCNHFQDANTLKCLNSQRRLFSSDNLRQGLLYYTSPEFFPIKCAQTALETIHSHTGLPWWVTILLTTVGVRTILLFPLMLYSEHNASKLNRIAVELKEKSKLLKREVDIAKKHYNWDERVAEMHFVSNMRRIQQQLRERDNCHPFKAFPLVFCQLPVWFGISLALRNMTGSVFLGRHDMPVLNPEIASEGALWFSNMLLPDQFVVLPLCMFVCNMLLTELYFLRTPQVSKFFWSLTWSFRLLNLFMFMVAYHVPSAVSLYWCASSMYGLAQAFILLYPTSRKFLRLPIHSASPLSEIFAKAKMRYNVLEIMYLLVFVSMASFFLNK